MQEEWKIYFSELIKGNQKGFISSFIKALLFFPSLGFRCLSALRNWAYDRGFFSCFVPQVPLVISIGNIVAGGTGKTPFTISLAKCLSNQGKIAILSRGYKSLSEHRSKPTLILPGNRANYSVEECGDEPYLLAKHLPDAILVIGKNRSLSAKIAKKHGADILILDDGMQHRQLARDLDIVMIHSSDPFGQGYFLPRGFLRDNISSLKRADLIVINHVSSASHFENIQNVLRPYASAPMIGTQMQPQHFLDAEGNRISSIEGKKVGLFCGIAHPEKFKEMMETLGATVVAQHFLSDHMKWQNDAFKTFKQTCSHAGAEYIVCTEKDFVKLGKQDDTSSLIWLKAELMVTHGQEHWENFLARAHKLLQRQSNTETH